jgi:hypothetical protein
MNSARTSQEAHYFSAAMPNRLMLFSEVVAVYCENHKKDTKSDHTVLKPNRLILFSRCLSREPWGTHKYNSPHRKQITFLL